MDDLTRFIFNNKPLPFEPGAFYIEDADSILFFVEDSDYFAERVDELLTLYLKMDDESLIGIEVKGVKHLLTKFYDQGRDGEVEFRKILMAYRRHPGSRPERVPYFNNIIEDSSPYNGRVKVPV